MPLGVTVDFNANLVKFSGQVDKMAENLDKFQVRAETMSGRVNKALGALGVGVSVAGLVGFVKSGIDAADALNDMADRTGIAVEKLAGFQLATKLADTDMEAFAKSANKLSIYIAKNSEEMKKLGVDAKDPAEAFLQFADVFSKIEDPQRRAALGAAVLGKSYADMAPLLLQGGEALRAQVADGQKMSGITTEQAKAAADLNDKLDTLNKRFTSLTAHTIGPLIPGLSNIAERFDYAAKKAQGFSDVFTEDFWKRVIAGSDPQMAIAGIKKIDEQIKDQQGVIERINKYPKLAAIENYDVGEEQRKLDILVERRGEAVKKLSMQNNPPPLVVPEVKIDQKAVEGVINQGSDKNKEVDQLAKKYADLTESMRREVALRGDNTEAAKMEYEVTSGSLAKLSEGQKIKLLNLATEKDAININIKAYEEYDQILAEGVDLAKKQRAEISADYDRLNQKFNGPLLDLNAGIADAMDARAQGIIPDDAKLKAVLDKMGEDYNNLTNNAHAATGQMSEFAVQAARNMQTSFADFLFDPFANGVEGMGANFVKILQRMVAEAGSAQIFEAFLGKNYGADNAKGGLLQAGFSGVSTFLSDLFGGGEFNGDGPLLSYANARVHHSGGIVGAGGTMRAVDSNVFSVAQRFHSGGWPGLKADEVPAILQTGERVLSRSEVAAAGNNSSGNVINQITIHVESGKNDSPDDTGRRIGEAFIRTIARDEINNAARPGNRLNPTTKF